MVEWTDEMVATLRKHVEVSGMSIGAAARLMGLNKNQAIGKASRMGIKSAFTASIPGGGALSKPAPERGARTWRTIPKPPPPVRSPPPRVGASPTCCWPLWGHAERPREYRFCGEASLQGQSWCPQHYPKVFNPVPRRSGAPAEFKLQRMG